MIIYQRESEQVSKVVLDLIYYSPKLMKAMVSVEKIASLAYLKLTEEEKKIFQTQFEQIIHYIDQLQKVPMTAEEAKNMGAYHVSLAFYKMFNLNPNQTLRHDKESVLEPLNLSNDAALKNSPKSGGIPGELLYEVPSIIDKKL